MLYIKVFVNFPILRRFCEKMCDKTLKYVKLCDKRDWREGEEVLDVNVKYRIPASIVLLYPAHQ
jgi:hypothetical protein